MKSKGPAEIIAASLSQALHLKKVFLKETKTQTIQQVAELLTKHLRRGQKVLLCGNGGSAADCQHWAGEMVGRFRKKRPALPFLALTTNTSVLTSIGNDESFEDVFARQVEAIGNPDDILVCISTSGGSANVLQAARKAKEKGLTIISLTGQTPNPLANLSDICLSVPSTDTPRIQEIHILLIHILCDLVESALNP
ncbi:MAG TPA: D-sedoheptulose 7-phosphate isomerase [bacterium]|nr:D-sedoheptulose 7-phosphate isomerase [bacterium]HPP11530.1 D-sedoheptulose 7-phosphate isomerase [bacterium]